MKSTGWERKIYVGIDYMGVCEVCSGKQVVSEYIQQSVGLLTVNSVAPFLRVMMMVVQRVDKKLVTEQDEN